jgi:site-specific recombinase XerD
MWESYARHFKNYLRLEKSLSENTVIAYLQDIDKLAMYCKMQPEPRTAFPGTTNIGNQSILQIFVDGKSATGRSV